MNTYLLAWNPRLWDWEDLAEQALQTAKGESVAGTWTCASKRIQPGDRLFLIRLGEEPRGIMASGWAQSAVKIGPHWDEKLAREGKERPYITYEFECLLDPRIDVPLSMTRLSTGELKSVHWSTQSSGILIPSAAANELEQVWEEYTAKSKTHQVFNSTGAIEGEIQVRLIRHRRREGWLRDQKLAQAKKLSGGALKCEVPRCGFNFESVYGTTGRGYAQVHHLKPLSDRSAPAMTSLDDLAIVCANCHAIIHRGNKCRELDTLIPLA